MIGMDGLAVMKTLRAKPETQPLPVLMLTAMTDEPSTRAVLSRGDGLCDQAVFDSAAYRPRPRPAWRRPVWSGWEGVSRDKIAACAISRRLLEAGQCAFEERLRR